MAVGYRGALYEYDYGPYILLITGTAPGEGLDVW